MTELPKIGIIYLTFPTEQWERDIDRCLTSLEKITYPKERIELICVESRGSRPPITAWFKERWMPTSGNALPRITYRFNDGSFGFSGNNETGYAIAKELGCEYVYLLNEDTDVEPEFLLRAVERAQQDPRVAIVQSLMLLGEERDKVNSMGNAFHYLGFGYSNGYRWTTERALAALEERRRKDPSLEIGYASGAAELVRTAAVEEIGKLFDDRFFSYHEDTDLSLQARLRGWKVVIDPRSVVYHHYVFAKDRINYFWMERNRYALIFTLYRPWTLLVIFPMLCVMDLAILLFSIKNGWADMKLKVYEEWFTTQYWRWIEERREQVRSARKISDRELLADAVSTIEFQESAVETPLLARIGNPLLRWYWECARRVI